MRRSAFFFVIASSLVLLGGCQSNLQHIGGTVAPKRYGTVVSLSPGASELVSSKLTSVVLVGRTEQCAWPAVNKRVPVVLKGVKPNYEQIAQIKPSVVVYDDLLFSPADIAKFKELGIDTFAITGNSIAEFKKCIYQLGKTFHGESTCSDYVDTIQAAVAAAEGSPPNKILKVAVLMPGVGSEHYIVGTESFIADAVRKAKGELVGPRGDRFVPASAESLVSMNPDVILSAGEASAIAKDPRLQSINAVRSNRIFPVDPEILLRRGGRVSNLIKGIYNILSETASSSQ